MKICSFNIWSDAPLNARWSGRRDIVAATLRQEEPVLAGLQEATLPMLRDLEAALPDYRWVGAGRADGQEKGEFTPILYQPSRVELLGGAIFWLSSHCDVPGRGWDATVNRIATWGRFRDRSNGHTFVHFNTHFDHFGRRARLESAKLLLRKAAEIAPAEAVFLTGDLNCNESSAPYRLLTGLTPFDGGAPAAPFRDAYRESKHPPEGPSRTYLGFFGNLGLGRIDYILVNGKVCPMRYRTVETPRGGSDHRAITAEVELLVE